MSLRRQYPKNRYPLSDALCIFMDNHPEVYNTLKLSNETRFLFIPIIGLTYLPKEEFRSNDEVIGMFYLDKVNHKLNKTPLFKQDFIVNQNSENRYYVSYSADKNNGKYIKSLSEFFLIYGKNGKFYHRNGKKPWQHHYDYVIDLPDYPNLRETAKALLKSAK